MDINNNPQTEQDSLLDKSLGEFRPVSHIAVRAADYHGINFELVCNEGDKVEAGTVLMHDAQRPAIRFTAAAAGTVSKIERSSRRKLVSLQIEIAAEPVSVHFVAPEPVEQNSMREFMLESGAWTALRTRPFGKIPDPKGEPRALFVNAMDADMLMPGSIEIIDSFGEQFRAGVAALSAISEAPLYVCHPQHWSPPVDASNQTQCMAFATGRLTSLASAHISALHPIGFGTDEVWHIGYQDVISLGFLLQTGKPWCERVITISGTGVAQPYSLRVPPGASLNELFNGDKTLPGSRLYSGLSKRFDAVAPPDGFLAAGHRQVSVMTESSIKTRPSRHNGAVIIPGDELEALVPQGIYAVPLLRALQIGDVDRARALGALELIEDDLSLVSNSRLSQCDYGVLLRQVLDQLELAD